MAMFLTSFDKHVKVGLLVPRGDPWEAADMACPGGQESVVAKSTAGGVRPLSSSPLSPSVVTLDRFGFLTNPTEALPPPPQGCWEVGLSPAQVQGVWGTVYLLEISLHVTFIQLDLHPTESA